MNIKYLIEFIFNLIDVSLLFYFVSKFIKLEKLDYKKIFMIILVQSTINMVVNVYFGISSLKGLFIMILSTGIIFRIIYKKNILDIYFIIVIGLTFMFICELLGSSFIIFSTGNHPIIFYNHNIFRIVGAVVSKLLFLLVIWKMIKKIRIDINNFKKSKFYTIFILCIFNIIIIFLGFLFFKYTNITKGKEGFYIGIMISSILLFNLLLLSLLKKILYHIEKEVEWSIKENEYEKQLFYIKNVEEILQSLKAQRHDFRHHISCLYGLIKLNKIEKTEKYIENLTEEIVKLDQIIDINNPIISSLLNIKVMEAKKNYIDINLHIDLKEKIMIEHIDLSIILGNLIDNSIESCINANINNKFIDIRLYTKKDNFIIKITNSKCKDIQIDNNILRVNSTTKEDTENHGFGLYNVTKTIEKYNGIIKIEDKLNTFIVSIGIPIY